MNLDESTLEDDDSNMIICSISGIPVQEFIDETALDSNLQKVIQWQWKMAQDEGIHSKGPLTILWSQGKFDRGRWYFTQR
ncbi:MAG: hypothetical protein GY679_04410 [Mycoplasma sp.]|nr:hypothetical protein [Mycoplasma sp.]